jgi:hypothetical protein
MVQQKFPPRIMYIECKAEGLNGPARIGRVTFSRTGATLHYGGKEFGRLGGHGFKANWCDSETGEHYWISGPRRDGADRLYKSNWPVEIDEDVREEYWTGIRKKPEWRLRAGFAFDNESPQCDENDAGLASVAL